MARPTKRTAVREKKFLAALDRGVSVGGAAFEAGLARSTACEWRAADAAFAALWDAAVEAGTDALEDEARRRAFLGVKTPVHYGGKKIGDIRKYSDALLMFMLRARRPETYRERITTEHVGKGGGPIETAHASLTDTERAQEVLRLLGREGGNGAGVPEHRKTEKHNDT